jgi:16S rRNA (uracil1498-N3)-methyltransferase
VRRGVRGRGLDLHPLAVPRFYVDAALRAGGSCELSEDTAHHAVHVLRIRAGEEVTLFNGRGGEYPARVSSIQKLRISVEVLAHRAIERESPLHVALIQGVSSGERMEFTIRKAVELGVAEIRPVLAAGSVARPKGERAAARKDHWQKIAISACEQCGRNQIPVVHPLVDASAYRSPPADDSIKILLSPASQLRFSEFVRKGGNSKFALAAGPEAGFDAKEEGAFLDAGFVPVKLGPRVLRTETAALAALAALNALLGDF